MVLKEELREHFAVFGVTVSEEATLNKCLDLCDTYNLDEESLVETWMAFSVSHCQGASPNVEYLCQMERKELKKDSGVNFGSGISAGNSSTQFNKNDNNLSKIAVYNSLSAMKQYDDNEDILEIYASKTPNTPKAKRLRSPEGELEINELKIRAVESPFSPASYSPKTATPSRVTSSNALHRGKILLKYGIGVKDWKNLDEQEERGKVGNILKSENHVHIPAKSLYMYEKLINKAEALDTVCEDLGKSMCENRNKIDKIDIDQVGSYSRSQYQIQTYGRICCDSDGKLNAASILLEGSKCLSSGVKVKIDLSKITEYSIFPGQVVSVKGINPTGKTLIVENLFFESPAPPAPTPQIKVIKENILDAVVAAGPFTNPDNLKYERLMELIDYVEEHNPHVFILIGPFVEFDHQEILKCNMSVTFDEFFEQCIANIMRRFKDSSTQVVIVSSNRDAHHNPVYPTPEFTLKQKYHNLHLMPDPCMIDIDGLIIGATSVDSMMHLGREEISLHSQSFDRLSRLATHVLAQKCFYPLVPPSKDLNVDTDLWEKHAFMDQQPHILILPSTLRYFCKNIYDCVALNPERLVKGSFARMRINYPTEKGHWKSANNLTVEVLKI